MEMKPVNNNQSAADKNAIAEPAEEPTSAPATEPPPPGEMLDSMVSLLRQYLVCDDHQLTVLALWCVHTWCFPCFSTAAYLNVRCPGPQSGKTAGSATKRPSATVPLPHNSLAVNHMSGRAD